MGGDSECLSKIFFEKKKDLREKKEHSDPFRVHLGKVR